jgi:hypothetical protein
LQEGFGRPGTEIAEMSAVRQPTRKAERSRLQEENEDAQPVPDRSTCLALHGARAGHCAGSRGIEPLSGPCDDPGAGASRTPGHAADGRSYHTARADRPRRPRRGSATGCGAAQLKSVQRFPDRTARHRPGHSWPWYALWLRHESVAIKIAAAAILVLALAGSARAETVLRLSETATVPAAPDELTAMLRAEAAAPTAAEAPRRKDVVVSATVEADVRLSRAETALPEAIQPLS